MLGIHRGVASMRLPLLVALIMGLPHLALANQAPSGANDAPGSSALVQNPCPPPLSPPQALAGGIDRMLKPGKLDADFAAVYGRPEVQEYLKAMEERARSDWPNLCRYRAANAELPKSPRTVFMGDSI